MGEIKPEAVGMRERITYTVAEDPAQNCMQDMGCRMVALVSCRSSSSTLR